MRIRLKVSLGITGLLAFPGSELRLPAISLPVAPSTLSRIDPQEDSTLERALVRRGSAVLPSGAFELTPSLFWGHSGRAVSGTSDNAYGAGLDARLGFQNGWMIGAGIPYLHRDLTGTGSNNGIGDSNFTIWKQISAGEDSAPSLVASLRYSIPTGDDFSQTLVPLGSGFHQLTGRLSALKTVAPITFFGDISLRYSFAERFDDVEIVRDNAYGVGFGATLAVTPDVASTASLRFSFEDDAKRNGTTIAGSSTTIGTLNLGLGVVLKQDIFMNINAAFGITDDAPDTALSISFPFRF